VFQHSDMLKAKRLSSRLLCPGVRRKKMRRRNVTRPRSRMIHFSSRLQW
jgi:hypothetical protein